MGRGSTKERRGERAVRFMYILSFIDCLKNCERGNSHFMKPLQGIYVCVMYTSLAQVFVILIGKLSPGSLRARSTYGSMKKLQFNKKLWEKIDCHNSQKLNWSIS